jgi:hypothetical protein
MIDSTQPSVESGFMPANRGIGLSLVCLGLFSATWATSVSAAGPVTVKHSGTLLQLGNDYLERTIDLGAGVRTTMFHNKLSGRFVAVSGDEFAVSLVAQFFRGDDQNPLIFTTKDFRLRNWNIVDEEGGGKRVVCHLANRRLDVTLNYELKPEDFYTRKWLELQGTNLFIDRIAVEKNHWYPAPLAISPRPSAVPRDWPDMGGLGQPLLGDDMFAGVEYPSSYNEARNSAIELWYYVGLDLSRNFRSESAVIGVAKEKLGRIAFMKYIERVRMSPPRLFLLFNSWGHLRGSFINSADMKQVIGELGDKFVNKYGVRLDSVNLDDQWDDFSKLWVIDKRRFPHGFYDVQSAAKQIGAGLGLWFGPMGGYGSPKRMEQAIRQGMESKGSLLCLAGKNYSRYFRNVTLEMQKLYHLNYFKMDGISLSCNRADHGHPTGIYAREAAIREWIATCKALHAQNPQTLIADESGPWMSPWWLLDADVVDGQEKDWGYLQTVPALSLRQAAIGYADAFWYRDFRVSKCQFPLSSVAPVGIVRGRFVLPGGKDESLSDWTDSVVSYAASGIMKWDLFISPNLLSAQQWGVLAHAALWAKANTHPLHDNSTMVLGDPAGGQPYGYVHFSPDKTIVALRNPSIQPGKIALKLDPDSGFEPSDREFLAQVIYPYRMVLPGFLRYGDLLRLKLDGYEQSVIELRPVEPTTIAVAGARFSPLAGTPHEMKFRLYGAQGATALLQLLNAARYKEIRIDDVKADTQTSGKLSIRFGTGEALVSQPILSPPAVGLADEQGGGHKLSVRLTVGSPADFQEAILALFLEPKGELPAAADPHAPFARRFARHPAFALKPAEGIAELEPQAQTGAWDTGPVVEARVNGKPAISSLVSTQMMFDGEPFGKGAFYALSAALTPGSNRVQIDIVLSAKVDLAGAKISGWFRGKRALLARDLTLVLAEPQPSDTSTAAMLPSASEVQNETYRIFEQRLP